tara:strand:+ start:67 stop:414 length:348 start_codon:yes stop_codon:yes gene_type:complete
MAQNVNFNKTVFTKGEYNNTINSSFTQLGVSTNEQQPIEDEPTVQQFFTLYNTLFYQIPEIGEINSHEYIIKTSSEYINFNENDELVQALQNEIAQLREDLLEAQQQVVSTSKNN